MCFRLGGRVVSIDKDHRGHRDALGCQCPVSLVQQDAHHCALHVGVIAESDVEQEPTL